VVDIEKRFAQSGIFLWISIIAKVCKDIKEGVFIICALKSFVQQFLKEPIGLGDKIVKRLRI
jgi:hypothetical protein